MNRRRRPRSSTYEHAQKQHNKGRKIQFLHATSSFYRFFCCPSVFPSPSTTNFAFLYKIESQLSEKITACRKPEATACRKPEATAWLLRVG